MSWAMQMLLIIGSVMTAYYVLKKIRRSRMRTEDSIFWLFFALILVLLGIFPGIAMKISQWIGVQSAANLVFLVIIFLLIYTYGAIRYGSIGFTTLRTFVNFFTDNAYYGISAVGMTMVLITGGIDLSVASVQSLTGMLIAYGYTKMGISPVYTMLLSILIALLGKSL